jgi:hypothetical protein
VGWQELDPLMGFVRDFIRPDDVIIRPHEYGGGMMDGTEYIVFSARRIRALKGEPPPARSDPASQTDRVTLPD